MKTAEAPGHLTRLGGVVALVALLLSGCPGQSTAPATNRADDLLKKMQTAYEQAHSYADAAELTEEVVGQGKQSIPFSVALDKPNKLRIEAVGISVVCDGKHFWSAVADDHLAGQVLFLPAPGEMTEQVLYHEPLLKQVFGNPDGVTPPQLSLLLANQPLERIFGRDPKAKWVGERSLPGEDSLCSLVDVTATRTMQADKGQTKDVLQTYTLWIDPKTYLLKRLETSITGDGAKSIVTIDFKGAQFNGKIAENAFKFEPPASAKLVNQFILPPQEFDNPAYQIIGQKPAFKFVDTEGKTVDAASLAGRVVVLDMWDQGCSWCFKSFPNLEKVREQFRDNPDVAILTVNLDTSETSSEKLVEIFKEQKIDLPIVRDPEQLAQSVFQVTMLPTMIVLGANGTVQSYDVGYNAHLADTLPKAIDQLLAGKDLSEQNLAEYHRLRAEFERRLAAATVGVNQEIEVKRAKIATRTEPTSLKIEPLWATEDVKNPGNLVVYHDAEGARRIAIFDGWRTIVELDAAGKTIARHAIELPEDGVATQLRTGVDAEGKRTFAVFAAAQQKIYLIDDEWRPAGSYPEETRQGIADVQLSDIDGDGKLEMLVAYLGEVGVQCASLAPKRIWSNRTFENALSLTVLHRDPDGHRRLLIGNEREAIGVLDYAGTQLADIPVAKRPIDVVVAANLIGSFDTADVDDPSQHEGWRLAALSASKPAEIVAVGLDFHGGELWTYPLPMGVRNTPCEVLIPGQLHPGLPGQWLLTGADGSIHILDADGNLIDKFQYGDELTGIGTMVADGQGVLLVATAQKLSAFRVISESSSDDTAPALGAPEEETAETDGEESISETASRPDKDAEG